MTLLRFDRADLELFAEASHDRNPLHLSQAYSRKTPYGEPVVFGVLGSIAAIGSTDRNGLAVSELQLTFNSPLYCNVDYTVEVKQTKASQMRVTVLDAGRIMQSCIVKFRESDAPRDRPKWSSDRPSETAEFRNLDKLPPGEVVTGQFSPATTSLRQLIDRWQLDDTGLSETQVACMLCCSYIVGMRLPGERALFSRLVIQFDEDQSFAESHVTYTSRIESYDDRFDLIQMQGSLQAGNRQFAHLQIASFVRPDSPMLSLDRIGTQLPRSNALRGKTGLLIGGSRGLGAAIAGALVMQNCNVLLNYHSSEDAAVSLRDRLKGEAGKVSLLPGDAGDAAWCRSARESFADQSLDFLICNATPGIRTLSLGLESVARMQTFLNDSISLTTVPTIGLLPLLESSAGTLVCISSAYASETAEVPADFCHYVAAKCAVEGFVRAVAAQATKLHAVIVRPPRVVTDQTNTPSGRSGAVDVESVAATIVQRLTTPQSDLRVDVIEFNHT